MINNQLPFNAVLPSPTYACSSYLHPLLTVHNPYKPSTAIHTPFSQPLVAAIFRPSPPLAPLPLYALTSLSGSTASRSGTQTPRLPHMAEGGALCSVGVGRLRCSGAEAFWKGARSLMRYRGLLSMEGRVSI